MMRRSFIESLAMFGVAMSGSGLAQTKEPKPTEIVYFSQHGKTYHKTAQCFVLSSKKVFQATIEAAKAHGLHPCHVCYKPGAEDWAKPVEER